MLIRGDIASTILLYRVLRVDVKAKIVRVVLRHFNRKASRQIILIKILVYNKEMILVSSLN